MDTVLTVTDEAVEKILLVRDREDDAGDLSLWIEVTGVDAFGKFGYDLWLAPASDAVEGDAIEAHGGFKFTIPRASVEALRGATLDRQGDLATGGLVIQPAHPLGAGTEGVAPPAELDGDTAARVGWVLDHHINPAIAAHGGTARLDRSRALSPISSWAGRVRDAAWWRRRWATVCEPRSEISYQKSQRSRTSPITRRVPTRTTTPARVVPNRTFS